MIVATFSIRQPELARLAFSLCWTITGPGPSISNNASRLYRLAGSYHTAGDSSRSGKYERDIRMLASYHLDRSSNKSFLSFIPSLESVIISQDITTQVTSWRIRGNRYRSM